MATQVLYATTNIDKFRHAHKNLKSLGMELVQINLDIEEVQSEDGTYIVTDKATKAFRRLNQPVLVNDDSWYVSALNGFPATNMKLCNHFLKSSDWLRLMSGVEDRKVLLISSFAYHDGSHVELLERQRQFHLLTQARGQHQKAPFLEVIARPGEDVSLAELISEGKGEDDPDPEFWKKLGEMIIG